MNRNHISDKNEISSEVENTLTLDCFLNAFSCARIRQSSFNANRIYIKPFSLVSSSMPSFTLFPSSIASSSVNLLFADSDSSMNLCNSFDFFNSGIFNLSSPISITCNNIGNAYIKHFLPEERTCAKKEKTVGGDVKRGKYQHVYWH